MSAVVHPSPEGGGATGAAGWGGGISKLLDPTRLALRASPPSPEGEG
jgi:hypothetical protein